MTMMHERLSSVDTSQADEALRRVRATQAQAAAPCPAEHWCTCTGPHDMHRGAELAHTDPDGFRHLETSIIAEDGQDDDATVAFGPYGVELTAAELRTQAAQLAAYVPQLLALADQLDAINAQAARR